MAKQILVKGATSQIVVIFIQDSSSAVGAGKTGLAFNTASLVAYYVRPGSAAVSITLATQTVTGAYSSGGFVEIDSTNMPGLYRLDIPDAALASGVNSVVVMLKGAANMAPVALEIQLSSANLNDSVRAGLTALPNAAAEASGGLFTKGTGAGQINQSANGQIDVNTIALSGDSTAADNAEAYFDGNGYKDPDNEFIVRSSTAQSGAASSITLDASASATDDIYNNTLVQIISGTGAGQSRIITDYVGATKVATVAANWITNPDNTSVFIIWPGGYAPIEANVTQWNGTNVATPDTAGYPVVTIKDGTGQGELNLTSGRTDANLTHIAGSAVSTTAAQLGVNVVQVSGDGTAADNLESAYDGTGYKDPDNEFVAHSGTAQAGAASTITLAAGAVATDDYYNNSIVFITGGTGAGQSRFINDYVGATKVITVNGNWVTSPDNTSTYIIIPHGSIPGASAPTAAEVRIEMDANSTKLASIEGDTQDIQNRIPSALISGRIDATVGAMQANVMTGTAADPSLATEIQAGLATPSDVATQVSTLLDAAIADSVPADGSRPSIRQALYMLAQFMFERSVSGTTITVKKVDGSTTLMTFVMDTNPNPTSISRNS